MLEEIKERGRNLANIVGIEEFKESFIDYLDVDDLTLKTYKTGIDSFIKYLNENFIKNPTRDDIIAYRNMLREAYSNNTVNTYMIAIRALFKYLNIHKMYENICEDIKGAKYSTTPKKQVLTLEQAQTIYSNLTDKKEKALFSLLITTGCRGIEVARAKIEDIQVYNNENVLWIQCKKHLEKDEYVKLSDQVMKDIKDYIGDRTSGYIFISTSNNNNGGGLTTTSLRTTIKNIFRRFGLEQDTFSLHSTRRSCATFMYENGADIHSIQQVLHHVSENTTVRYINAVTRDKNKNEYLVSNAIFG